MMTQTDSPWDFTMSNMDYTTTVVLRHLIYNSESHDCNELVFRRSEISSMDTILMQCHYRKTNKVKT